MHVAAAMARRRGMWPSDASFQRGADVPWAGIPTWAGHRHRYQSVYRWGPISHW